MNAAICYSAPSAFRLEPDGKGGFTEAWPPGEHCFHPWPDGRSVCCWCGSPLVKVAGHWWCGHPTSNVCRARQRKHAQYAVDRKGTATELVYLPLPKQAVWHEAVYDAALVYVKKCRVLQDGLLRPGVQCPRCLTTWVEAEEQPETVQ